MTSIQPPPPASPVHRGKSARAPGRPLGEGSELRERLLGAALSCFARDGIAGSSLRAIATEAGTTPALLHYYFGNRDALKDAVVEEKVMPVMQGLQAPLHEADIEDPRALIRGFVRSLLSVAMAHPWLPRLWVREVLHEGGGLRGLIQDRLASLPRGLAAHFARAQAQGRLNPRLDPRLLVPSLIGQTMFMAASAPIWRSVLDAHDIDTEALCEHVLILLEHGLELGDE
jgi:TetR/AcrR family transcriptional regulator